ncbi:glycosyltransferase [Flavobacterium sp. GT3P67]|uniref:glycosyltransferase n=1 Tax=Flavobacterium sp. GT3P67 TaxID=2541722 RepID=UPI0010457524|nr:glycosyltransferase [Flavobacterium sp. GT3P67]TDE53921.1 glycosyltransferase [Flavobacterium sp. GT3P67]
MRILQLVDSLEAGGAERMAVNYANALAKQIEFSGLVVSRKEGPLVKQIDAGVSYLFLNRNRVIDFKALFKLRNYVAIHKVEVIHTHSTSFFLAFLLKLLCPSIKIIWHDHYGDSEFLNKRPLLALRLITPFFSGIIAVNQKLKVWANGNLHFENSIYLPNFPSEEKNGRAQTVLKGTSGKRIVSLANLRVQKDHFLLLEVAKKLKVSYPDWTFHLVGKDFEDAYSKKIKNLIVEFNLGRTVFFYGTKQDVSNILNQSTIAILTSKSEGLPVALLEYGKHKMPVVVTNVGEISSLVRDRENGFIVVPQNEELFYNSLVLLMENDFIRINFGETLYKTVLENNSEEVIIKQYLSWLQNNKRK